VATAVVGPENTDTTGLPPGAAFGPSAAYTSPPQSAHPDGSEGPLRAGQAFGPRYHIIRLLGAGGMGAVYQAWDAELNVAVALKLIRSGTASPDFEKRLKNELLLARQVTHKHVVRIHDLGELDGTKYISMPYVQGEDLASVLRRRGALGIGRALALARQIARGLEAAHDAGVVHRDLKPANVMISGVDDLHALIMDFGISSSSADASASGMLGTPEYMAPEQATHGTVDARADVYAFGLILYEMIAGPRAPAGSPQSRIDAMKRRFADGVPRLRAVDPAIPDVLDAFVARCLNADPAARFRSGRELRAALETIDDRGFRTRAAPRVGGRLVAAAAATVALLVGATWWFTRTPPVPKAHDPVSVVIADFENRSNDATFDHTLEPMLKLALEGTGFITAYDRNAIRSSLGVQPPESLDEQSARELAVKQGQGVVLSGSLERNGASYTLAIRAIQAVAGTEVASVKGDASGKDQVLGLATQLATRVRTALGDDNSETAQRFAMETLSATSLDVVREYALAMDALSNNKFEEALAGFERATKLDGGFGLAYAGMAISAYNVDRQQDAEKYVKEAVRHVDRMTERERYRTRGMYYFLTGDYQQCVKEYADLIARYSADVAARNNLALCSTQLRDMPRAIAEMRRVVAILPKRTLYQANLALYSDYGGDFQAAETVSRNAQDVFGLLSRAFAQLGQAQLQQAAATYREISTRGALGASYAASGLGDLALHEGRFDEAIEILSRGVAGDVAAKDVDRAAAKLVAIGYAQLQRGRQADAIRAAERALASSTAIKIRFLSGRVLAEAGDAAAARKIADSLAAEVQTIPQAYAKLLRGALVLKTDPRASIQSIGEANAMLDTWIGHFDLGRAFFEAGAFAQADSEFDRCLKRRGEALSLFLDEEPTYAYLPAATAYQARVRERLRAANAG
jgi:tetratricopeptide (TPR) repeat protein